MGLRTGAVVSAGPGLLGCGGRERNPGASTYHNSCFRQEKYLNTNLHIGILVCNCEVFGMRGKKRLKRANFEFGVIELSSIMAVIALIFVFALASV